MHDPLLRPDLRWNLGKTGVLAQSLAEVAAEEARECSDREQEVGASWQPGLSIRGEATGRHEIVHMRVVAQVTRPGVEDPDEANLAADETRITCQSLGRRG